MVFIIQWYFLQWNPKKNKNKNAYIYIYIEMIKKSLLIPINKWNAKCFSTHAAYFCEYALYSCKILLLLGQLIT